MTPNYAESGQDDYHLSSANMAQYGGDQGKQDPIGKDHKLNPRTAREFRPSSNTAYPAGVRDGPPQNSVINYLSSECISLTDLNWWTSDRDIIYTAAEAGVLLNYGDITFAEHKVNGKSKGSVIIDCRSPERASMIVHWFHYNPFQGKKVNPSYVTNGEPGKPGYNGQRPSAGIQGTAPFATNAHGGINFNRLRPLNRQPMPQLVQHAKLGMGRPNKGLFHKIESGQLGIQDGMQYGDWPRQAASGYPALQSHYPTYTSIDLDHPANQYRAMPSPGLPYGEGLSFVHR